MADLVIGAMISRIFLTPAREPGAPAPTGETLIGELRPFLLRAPRAQPT